MKLSQPIPSTVAVVAVCATLSFLACISLFSYIAWKLLAAHRAARVGDVVLQARANDKLRFVRSQFGVLFINLLISDCLQSIGFGFGNYHWIRLGAIDSDSPLCTFQSVLIQIGDTASAFWVLAIGAHTMAVLVKGRKPPKAVLLAVGVLIWGLVILFAVIGPTAIASPAKGQYYTEAGAWCWIGSNYENERLYLHYLWLFIVAGLNVLFYAFAIWTLRGRAQSALSKTLAAQDGASGFWARLRRALSTSSNASSTPAKLLHKRDGSNMNPHLAAQARVRTAARKMVFYPLVYIALVMPLTAFRLTQFTGHHPPITAQIAVGSIFTLSGLANTLLCIFTRGVYGRRSNEGRARGHSSQPSGGSMRPSTAGSLPSGYVFSRETVTQVDVPTSRQMMTPVDILTSRQMMNASQDDMLELKDGKTPPLPYTPELSPAFEPTTPSYELPASSPSAWQAIQREQWDRELDQRQT